MHGHNILTSFIAEDQKSSLDTKWNGDIPLDPEDWLVHCGNVALNLTGSDFIVVEDDYSIGYFLSRTRRVSFNNVPEVFTCENTNRNVHARYLSDSIPLQLVADEKSDDDFSAISLFTKVVILQTAHPISLEEHLDSRKPQIKTLHEQCWKVTRGWESPEYD